MKVLEIKHLYKTFKGGFSLKDINLELHKGKVHVLVGENGSGKSVLMKIISGMYQKDSGLILLGGKPMELTSFSQSRAYGIYYQHQDAQLFDNLTVAENIYFDTPPGPGFQSRFVDQIKTASACKDLFNRFGITTVQPQDSVARLGFAERQLVSVVKAFASGSQIIIYDEPTAGMSETERDIFFSMLSELKKHCWGIFYISHRMDEIAAVGDQVTVLHQGKVLITCSAKNMDHKKLVRIMSGEIHKERYPRLSVPKKEVILSLKHLEFKPILKDVSFELRKGEILGITGLMGSGRTCLANCLYGIQQPTGGEMLVEGKPVVLRHPFDALVQGIALVPEDREENAIFQRLDLAVNVTVASLDRFQTAMGLDTNIMDDLVHEYVTRLTIKPGFTHDDLSHYSGGNQQKVMVARWFMRRAKVYILDEPTRGVDIMSKVDIYNAISDLLTKGASVILISSDIEEILGMCDRTLVLSGGTIVADLPWETATKQDILNLATQES